MKNEICLECDGLKTIYERDGDGYGGEATCPMCEGRGYLLAPYQDPDKERV